MITKEEVKHIAKLARLGITEEELEKFQGELSSILGYIEQLQKVNTKSIEPTSHITGVQNVMREDEVYEGEERHETKMKREETVKKLVEIAPERERGWVKVKSVL